MCLRHLAPHDRRQGPRLPQRTLHRGIWVEHLAHEAAALYPSTGRHTSQLIPLCPRIHGLHTMPILSALTCMPIPFHACSHLSPSVLAPRRLRSSLGSWGTGACTSMCVHTMCVHTVSVLSSRWLRSSLEHRGTGLHRAQREGWTPAGTAGTTASHPRGRTWQLALGASPATSRISGPVAS